MNIDFYGEEELKFPLADQQQIKLDEKYLYNNYSSVESVPINFYDLFQIDPSDDNSDKSQSNFFSNKNIKQQKESKQLLTIYLKESLGNLKTRRKTVHSTAAHLLKNIENIVIPGNKKQLIELFLNSHYFLWFIRLITIINLVGIFMIDYSFRIIQEQQEKHLSTSNIISLSFQLFANCVFTFEIMLRIYQNQQNAKNSYVLLNIIGTIACWATIFFDMIECDQYFIFRTFMILRIVRAIVRILEVFSFLRTPFEIFMNTIPSLKKLFFPLIILMLFYATAGMALFAGANKYRCAQVHQNHEVTYGSYCGASAYECPHHQKCIFVENIQHRGLETLQNQFNLVTFDNIGSALFTIYHFIYNTNFSNIRGKFTYYINPYVSSLFFISSSVIFCYIFSNLIMVSMSKAYIQEVQRKSKEQKVQIISQQQYQPLFIQKIVDTVDTIIIILQTITICLVYKGMSQLQGNIQLQIDFIFLWISCLILVSKAIMQKGRFLSNEFNKIGLFAIGMHLIDLIICGIVGEDIIYSTAKFSTILKTFKILRIVKLLYINKNIFTYQKYVINVFIQTLKKIKFFILLILCFIFMFKQLGELFFAYQIRFQKYEGSHQEVPFINNYEGFIPSFQSILFLFFNQAWSQTMYFYHQAVGKRALFFFIVLVFVAFLMVMRLYIAVFLCYFKAQLHKKQKKQLICEKSLKKDQKQSSNHQQNKNQTQKIKSTAQMAPQKQQSQENRLKQLIRVIYRTPYFDYIIDGCIYLQSLVIILKHSTQSSYESLILDSIQNICLVVYILQVILGSISEGLYFPSSSFLKKSRSNIISFSNTFIILASFIPYGNFIINNYLRRITFIKVFTLFRNANKQMTIIIDSIFVICKNFFNFVLIYIFFLLIAAIIPLKMFYNNNPFHICVFEEIHNDSSTFYTEQQCTLLGGSWQLPQQNFYNIIYSLAFMYQLVSTQSWSAYTQSLWNKNQALQWRFYFSMIFFVYNICFLNIFLGFIVETYLQLKDKAYNLNLLKGSQKGWILIKNRINALFPKSVLSIDPKSSAKRKLIFGIVISQNYEAFFDYLAYLNALLYVITYQDQSGFYAQILNFFKKLFCSIFLADTILKAFSLRFEMFTKDNSYLQCLGSIYIMIYWAFYLFSIPNNETAHILEFFLVLLLLTRCKSLLLKYSWCKTNLNSVIDILPKCGNIIKLVGTVLFFYASLGLEIFKYVKPDYIVDEYNIGFNNIHTAIITLIRVSVAEAWHTVVSGFIKHSSAQHICYNISNEEVAKMYGNMGCGTYIAYPYFLSFHVIMVLLLLNLLIATMASAYDDNFEIEFNSVNIFQLEDCLNLWQKYDPTGTGVVHYKKFWRLTSQIAILFGISKKKLIKRKNKFFEELDLQIYQHKDNPIFCYRFHDVITKFSKIKLQIANLGSEEDPNSGNKDNECQIQFDINPDILKEIKDYVIPFPDSYYQDYNTFKNYKSGQTKYIFGLLKKLRQWKHSSSESKRTVVTTKLSSIFDIKSKRFEAEPFRSEESLDKIA